MTNIFSNEEFELLTIDKFFKCLSNLKGKKIFIQNMVKIRDENGAYWDASTVLSHITINDVIQDEIYIHIIGVLENMDVQGVRGNSVILRKKYITTRAYKNENGYAITVEEGKFLNVINLFIL